MAFTMTSEDGRLAENIDLARKLRGWSNRHLAEQVGRPGKTGHNWAQQVTSGTRPITYGQLCEIAAALEIPERVLQGDPGHILRYFGDHRELMSGSGVQLSSYLTPSVAA